MNLGGVIIILALFRLKNTNLFKKYDKTIKQLFQDAVS